MSLIYVNAYYDLMTVHVEAFCLNLCVNVKVIWSDCLTKWQTQEK